MISFERSVFNRLPFLKFVVWLDRFHFIIP